MHNRLATDTPVVANSHLARARASMRLQLPRTLLVMVALCSAIALFLNGFVLTRLAPKLVYSFAIGFSCWAANSGGRLLTAWCFDRRRAGDAVIEGGKFGVAGWTGVGVGMVLGLLLGPAIGLSLGDWFYGDKSPSLMKLDSPVTRITLILTVGGSVVAAYVLSNIERLASARALAEAAQRQAAETQLRLLQSQLEPHMLFNTLANLRVLIGIDPTRAQAMLDRLIAFLRATLNASRVAQHPLATEFERLNDYLALMAIRMGPRLQVRLHLPENLTLGLQR